MSQAIPDVFPSLATFADVVASVGQVAHDRVRRDPAPGLATEADVLRVYAQEKRLCELIDGVLVEKAVGAYESLLAVRIAALLQSFVDRHDLGVVLGEAGMLKLAPGLVRIPDVCFIAWGQLPGKVFPRQAIPTLHPDLAVEVLSEGNTRAEMHRKLHDYFKAGAQLVWYLDPQRREMAVYTGPTELRVVTESGVLDGGALLPGFQLPLAEVFRVPQAG